MMGVGILTANERITPLLQKRLIFRISSGAFLSRFTAHI